MQELKEQIGLLINYNTRGLMNEDIDCELQLSALPSGEITPINYLAYVKLRVNNAILGQIANQAKRTPRRFVLVSDYITQPHAERLRQLNISFFDTAGNAYFNEPNLYVFVSGKKIEVNKEKSLGLFRPAGMKLLLAFLIQPGMENADYRTIADDTDVPRTTVGELINDLERAGFLVRRGGRERFLTRKSELIKRWVESYSERYRIKLNPVRYHSTKATGRWWEEIDITEYKAVWGGETGGAKLTKHLKPQTATIYADSNLPKLQAKYGLVRDEKGEIEILKRFWKFGEVGNVAPPLVVYADLLATADERNLETAQIIYDEYLAKIAEENS